MKTCKDCHRLSVERERLSDMLTGANNREGKLIIENARLQRELELLQSKILQLEASRGQ